MSIHAKILIRSLCYEDCKSKNKVPSTKMKLWTTIKNAMVHGTLLVPCTIALFRKTKGIEWVCVDT